jgi:hexosaminidase
MNIISLNELIVLFFILPAGLALWPMPHTIQAGSTYLKLSSTFDIIADIAIPPSDLLFAVNQTKYYLLNDKLQVCCMCI